MALERGAKSGENPALRGDAVRMRALLNPSISQNNSHYATVKSSFELYSHVPWVSERRAVNIRFTPRKNATDETVSVVGATTEMTLQRRTHQQDAWRSREQLSLILGNNAESILAQDPDYGVHLQKAILESQSEASIDGILVVAQTGRIISYNQRFLEIWGLSSNAIADRMDASALRAVEEFLADREHFLARVRHLYQKPDEHSFDEIALIDGRTLDRYSAPVKSADGTIYGRVWFFRDATARKQAQAKLETLYKSEQAARREAEATQRRLQFLLDASAALGASLDHEDMLTRLAKVLVPEIGDGCYIDLYNEDGDLQRIAVAHIDPQLELLAREWRQRFPSNRRTPDMMSRRICEGKALMYNDLDLSALRDIVGNEPQALALHQLGICSAMVVPLVAHDRVLGAILMTLSNHQRKYTEQDLSLAVSLAARAALAVENARIYREAQTAARSREELLAVVSHDLRTPLSVIKMKAGQMLQRYTPDDGNREQRDLNAVLRASSRMERLITDLLDVASIDAGRRLQLLIGSVDIESLLLQAIDLLQPLAIEKNQRLTLGIHCKGRVIACDRERMLQVLSNIIGNAIKFTPNAGSIVVQCQRSPEGALFSVRDTGPGIAVGQIPHMFTRYWQSDQQDQRGLGLGLYISKGIVEAHGGRIWVESEVNEGTQVHFTLPIA